MVFCCCWFASVNCHCVVMALVMIGGNKRQRKNVCRLSSFLCSPLSPGFACFVRYSVATTVATALLLSNANRASLMSHLFCLSFFLLSVPYRWLYTLPVHYNRQLASSGTSGRNNLWCTICCCLCFCLFCPSLSQLPICDQQAYLLFMAALLYQC